MLVVKGALKLVIGLVIAPCLIAGLFIWLAQDNGGLAADLERWGQFVPFALVPVVIAAGLLSAAVSPVRDRHAKRGIADRAAGSDSARR